LTKVWLLLKFPVSKQLLCTATEENETVASVKELILFCGVKDINKTTNGVAQRGKVAWVNVSHTTEKN
jgi:hypothetical protein